MSTATDTKTPEDDLSENSSTSSETEVTKESIDVSIHDDVVNQFGSALGKISSDDIRENLNNMLREKDLVKSLVTVSFSSRLQVALAELFRRQDYTTVFQLLSFLQDESRLETMYSKCLQTWSIWLNYHLEKIEAVPKDLALQLLRSKLQDILSAMKQKDYVGVN